MDTHNQSSRPKTQDGYGRSSSYIKLGHVGNGTYSTVYQGFSQLTNTVVALKEIHLREDEGLPFNAIREVSLLKELRHANIVTLHDFIATKKTLTLVFEFVPRDLSAYMSSLRIPIQPYNVKLFLFQILRGLNYCHIRKVLHRDLKPQNILVRPNGEIKLADFGLARTTSVPIRTFTDEVASLWYRPPDVLLGNVNYGTSIDMWAVGCIFFEMITRECLFRALEPDVQVGCIFEILGIPDDSEWPSLKADLAECHITLPTSSQPNTIISDLPKQPNWTRMSVDLLMKFLKCNPRSRISAEEALKHEYFLGLPQIIHELPDTESIFSISSIKLQTEGCPCPANIR